MSRPDKIDQAPSSSGEISGSQSLLLSFITATIFLVLHILLFVFLGLLALLLIHSSCGLTGTTILVSAVRNIVSGTHDLVFCAVHTVAAASVSVGKAALTRHWSMKALGFVLCVCDGEILGLQSVLRGFKSVMAVVGRDCGGRIGC